MTNSGNACPDKPHLQERPDLKIGSGGGVSYLIHGDNDQALVALVDSVAASVKCVYIDPPYNNMESYVHYEDRDGHEEWIQKLVTHVTKLKNTLTDDGSLWISIDDHQVHYLKVALDNIFGRENFISTIVWEHRKTRENRRTFSNNHEYILVYAKDHMKFKGARNRLPYTSEVESRFKNPDHDPRGPWQSISLNVQAGHATKNQFHTILAPSGKQHMPPNGRCWMYNSDRVKDLVADNRIWFGKSGHGVPRLKRFLSEIDGGLTPQTLWKADEVGTTESAKKDVLKLFPGQPVFDTPKPVELITRIFQIAANPGDLVLDSFLGSGTSAIAALQNDLRFIGIEQGDHVLTHCHKRISSFSDLNGVQIKFFEVATS